MTAWMSWWRLPATAGARTKHKLPIRHPDRIAARNTVFHRRRRPTVNAAEQRYFALGQPRPAAELISFLNSLRPNTKGYVRVWRTDTALSDRWQGPARSSPVARDDPEPHAGGHFGISANVNDSRDDFRGRGSFGHRFEDATAGSEGMTRRLWAAFVLACVSASASSTAAWEMNTYADFMRGRFSGCLIDARWKDRPGSAA